MSIRRCSPKWNAKAAMTASTGLAYRDRAQLPRLGSASLRGPLLLDTNVFLNALTGRGPDILQTLLANLPQCFVCATTIAELTWTRGRLDPDHPQTAKVLATLKQTVARIDSAKILTPTADQWRLAGERAGTAVRGVARPTRAFSSAADRHEMLNDALTAVVASHTNVGIVTQDADFDLFMQLDQDLRVLFYDRP
jgi:predicted nucleic acid-binding protein